MVEKHDSLWCNWINNTALKRHKFWTMKVPTDCSCICRHVLNLRPLVWQFLQFNIGNGNNTSLWFDPWWRGSFLAKRPLDHIISKFWLPTTGTITSSLLMVFGPCLDLTTSSVTCTMAFCFGFITFKIHIFMLGLMT